MPIIGRRRKAEDAVARDTETIPYRQTAFYRDNAEKARQQRGRMHFRVQELWAQNVGNSTSGMLRRPTGAMG